MEKKIQAKEILIIGALIALVLGIGFFLFTSNPKSNPSSDVTPFLLKIDSINKELLKLEKEKYDLERLYDSLLNVETKIIYRTREKIRFITLSADPAMLDSIIRTSWKPDSGFHPMLQSY